MAADVLITFLPCEVIEYILINDNLTIKDIIYFSQTCKQLFKIVINSNKIWRTKFFKRWPNLKENYDKSEKLGYVIPNWMEEYRASLQSRRELLHELSQMSSLYYKKQELSHSKLRNYDRLFRRELGAHPFAYYSITDELINIIDESPLTSNLTHKYYAYKVIKYIKQSHLSDEWNLFLNLPENKKTLERGALLVSQWSQPERRVSDIFVSSQLNNIADTTKKLLHEINPCHPIFSTSIDKLNEWKDTNIYDHQWNSDDTRQIMTVLCDVMFKKMAFYGNSEMYYSSVNSFIDQVLENRRGIPITLAIIFESVARRLGVRCEAVSFPAHFLLRFSDEIENFYIDVFNGGQFLTKKSCPKISGISKCPIERHNLHDATSAIEVVQRMANNLELAGRQRTHLNGRAARLRSALDLLHLVRPNDTGTILHLARFYILHQMDLTELVEILNNMQKNLDPASKGQANHILRMLQDYEKHTTVINEDDVAPKIHPSHVKYGVGMIMRHRIYGYLCVITGWDEKCEATPDWINEMGVNELLNGPNQPFYNLLADDGSIRYAAEENLIIAPDPDFVCHDEIGRFFYKYCGTHYLPNAEKQREYPTDADVRDQYFAIAID